jgi:hypothetical protein
LRNNANFILGLIPYGISEPPFQVDRRSSARKKEGIKPKKRGVTRSSGLAVSRKAGTLGKEIPDGISEPPF